MLSEPAVGGFRERAVKGKLTELDHDSIRRMTPETIKDMRLFVNNTSQKMRTYLEPLIEVAEKIHLGVYKTNRDTKLKGDPYSRKESLKKQKKLLKDIRKRNA